MARGGVHRSGRRSSWRLALAIGVVAGAAVAASVAVIASQTSSHHSSAGAPPSHGTAPPTTSEQAVLAAAVVSNPVDGATNVTPDSTVEVKTSLGHLTSVTVSTSGSLALTGSLNPGATQWTSSGPLTPSSHYAITAVVTNQSGTAATTESTFTTVSPTALVRATVWPDSGLTVGVGQPIVLTFTQPIITPSARTELVSHLHLSLSKPVPVGAYWFSNTELHLRPQTYWSAGEQISFSDDLAGWNAGSGEWGQGSTSVRFAIGDARISTANLTTHEMTVTLNGKAIATYPISAGRTQYPTMDGVHIVLDRESKVQMISSSVGIPVNSPNGYNETVYWDVHISDSGEYVHSAPWSVADQGSINVSHGCINLSPANAQQFFQFSRVGDVVNVVGGPRAPVPTDGGVEDWSSVPWTAFTPVTVSAL
jgi:lipoprotein-anchoring transpeptidase ErfK/SrfK